MNQLDRKIIVQYAPVPSQKQEAHLLQMQIIHAARMEHETQRRKEYETVA